MQMTTIIKYNVNSLTTQSQKAKNIGLDTLILMNNPSHSFLSEFLMIIFENITFDTYV